MIPTMLQDDLVEKLKDIFKDFMCLNRDGKLVPLKFYKQDIDLKELSLGNSDKELRLDDEISVEITEEEEQDDFPCIIVRVENWKTLSGTRRVRTILVIGAADSSPTMSGSKDILNIAEKIEQYFLKYPILNKKYVFDEEFEFWQQDQEKENTFPYFFGGIEMWWNMKSIRREIPGI